MIIKGIYKTWMRIAHVIGLINSKILFTLVFYVIFTPVGLFMKLMGKDLLDARIDKTKNSYWIKRDRIPVKLEQYEKQF